ncbi:hypothetical protein ACOAOT_23670 [Lacrimispora sp. AGF001]|uniref:hypothetical protein n=1 Tax=Lacrimispora sp. AGF001 TaxID=3401631 RepID=UPI003B42C4FE
MKKNSLALVLAMTTVLLTACQSSVSKEAYESLEARANQAESEVNNLKESFENLNASLEESKANAEQKTKYADFSKHETVSTSELPEFLQNDQEALKKMLSAAGVAFIDAGIGTKDLDFLGFENYEKTEGDKGKENSGFRIDLIFKTSLRKVSCSLYYFNNTGEWTFVGIKDYDNLHWYYLNSGMNIDVPLYDYETDTLKE